MNPTTSISEINISEFLDIVNDTHRSILSQDVLDHFGEERPANGYYTGRALFQQWDDMTEDEQRAEINAAMTMEQARTMVQKAFVAGEIKEWYGGEYRNGDEWLRAQGADEVAMYIENEYELQRKYINSNEHINNEDYTIIDVLEAYLAGTLTGKVKKAVEKLVGSTALVAVKRNMRVPLSAGVDLRVMLFGCRTSGEKSDLNNIYNIAAFVLQYYISIRLSGEIEKKSAIRKNPNDTVRRETENPERILETVVSHYILIIRSRQISGAVVRLLRTERNISAGLLQNIDKERVFARLKRMLGCAGGAHRHVQRRCFVCVQNFVKGGIHIGGLIIPKEFELDGAFREGRVDDELLIIGNRDAGTADAADPCLVRRDGDRIVIMRHDLQIGFAALVMAPGQHKDK